MYIYIDASNQINHKIKNAYKLSAVKLLHVYNFIYICSFNYDLLHLQKQI